MMNVGILLTAEDVDNAVPGPYIVHSKHPAYFPAMALLEAGNAQFRGEYYDDNGRAVLLTVTSPASLAGLGQTDEDGAGQVQRVMSIDPHYFTAALKDYRDWKIKWWREAVQNAVDAGATNIALSVVGNEDGTYTVSCEDDGGGMSRDVLLNKFLSLGATTKVGAAGKAGGFGKAKELLLLPWLEWRVHSRDTLAVGRGIDHTVSNAPYRDGTLLQVTMSADNHTDEAYAIGFIEKCYLPQIRFTVNGIERRANLQAEKLVRSFPDKVDLYYTPTKETQSYLYVRTRGIYMFSIYISEIPGFLLAELIAPSIEILTANRDGFADRDTAYTVETFAEKVAKDNLSALKASRGMIRKKYEGTGKFQAKKMVPYLLDEVGPSTEGISDSSIERITRTIGEFAQREERYVPNIPTPAAAGAMLDIRFTGANHIEAAIKQLAWQPDFYVINEIDGFTIPKKFFPETMTPTIRKLARVWTELCRFVLMQLGSDEPYGVGFIFSTSAGAAALSEGDRYSRENWLLLNPFKDLYDRTDIWRATDRNDLSWLYMAAIHEATHIADGLSYHDESFASALTRNGAKCMDGFRKVQQIVNGLRMRDEAKADV